MSPRCCPRLDAMSAADNSCYLTNDLMSPYSELRTGQFRCGGDEEETTIISSQVLNLFAFVEGCGNLSRHMPLPLPPSFRGGIPSMVWACDITSDDEVKLLHARSSIVAVAVLLGRSPQCACPQDRSKPVHANRPSQRATTNPCPCSVHRSCYTCMVGPLLRPSARPPVHVVSALPPSTRCQPPTKPGPSIAWEFLPAELIPCCPGVEYESLLDFPIFV